MPNQKQTLEEYREGLKIRYQNFAAEHAGEFEDERILVYKFWLDEIKRVSNTPQSFSWEAQQFAMRNHAAATKRVTEIYVPKGTEGEEIVKFTQSVVGKDLTAARNEIPFELGERFDSHGIAKGNQLDHLVQLLENGVDNSRPLHSLQLHNRNEVEAGAVMGSVGPYDRGDFIVISDIDKSLLDGIRLVLVNYTYRESATLLARHYPDTLFATPEGTLKALRHLAQERS